MPLRESLRFERSMLTLETANKTTILGITNTGGSKLLIFPSVCPFQESQSSLVRVSPLVCELEVTESTTIEYLHIGGDADTEQLFRARFEWTASYDDSSRYCTEASIPLLVQPAIFERWKEPCELLLASISQFGDVIIENGSKQIAFLSPIIELLPSRKTFVIPQRYIAPQSWHLLRAAALGTKSWGIRITSETPTGTRLRSIDIELGQWISPRPSYCSDHH
ncbi:putative periplasmic chaperone protein [Caballeronia pedi]|uniref:Periplasmic chaperone protein n=1 Tax=Caballeronia pedi TaxID=1777141 RepID=A0A158BH06_9BURK|nr:putative periplasmic chaperone protein [Caballeronia pedi]